MPMPPFPRPIGKPNWSAEIEAILSYLDTATLQEALDRTNADSSEATVRSQADADELAARTGADTTEQNARIAADTAETNARIAIPPTFPGAYKNVIRNSDVGVTQRGLGPFAATAGGAYSADGWTGMVSGVTMQQVVTPLSLGASPLSVNYMQMQMSGSCSGASDYCLETLRIEDVRTLSNKTVTLSFYAATNFGRTIGLSYRQNFGTGGSPSASVNGVIGKQVLTNSMIRYSFTFTLPGIFSGKTLGTNGNDYLEIRFWMGSGSTNIAESGLTAGEGSQAGFNFNITAVQLEEGSVATLYEKLPRHAQVAWCQRYFYRLQSTAIQQVFGTGTAATATQGYLYIQFPVHMRAAPTFTQGSTVGGTSWLATDRIGEWVIITWALGKSTIWGADTNFTIGTASMTPRAATFIYPGVSGGPYIEFSAEL